MNFMNTVGGQQFITSVQHSLKEIAKELKRLNDILTEKNQGK